jgi:hypothetical protein
MGNDEDSPDYPEAETSTMQKGAKDTGRKLSEDNDDE